MNFSFTSTGFIGCKKTKIEVMQNNLQYVRIKPLSFLSNKIDDNFEKI